MKVTFQTTGNKQDYRAVRTAVFMEEQGFQQEFDEIDEVAFHVTMYVEEALAGCARMFHETDPTCVHFGRIALYKQYRGTGLGTQLVKQLEVYAKEKAYKTVELSAQYHLRHFYEQMGYVCFGGIVYDEGVAHINMKKIL